jgi:hypothetical protein
VGIIAPPRYITPIYEEHGANAATIELLDMGIKANP